MGRKKRKLLEKVEITGIADKGKAVGRFEDRVIFMEGPVPGDVVDVEVGRFSKGFYKGFVKKYHQYSTDRVAPKCAHFGVCGGCKWQQLDYEVQLAHKHQTVSDALRRIGKVDVSNIRPIIGGEETEFYRNKLEFSFSNKRWLTEEEIQSEGVINARNALGFHRPGAFDKIVDVEKCWLQPEPSNAIRNAVRDFALANDLSFFDIRNQEGFLRQLFVRVSGINEVMVMVSFFYENKEKREALLQHLAEQFPEINALLYVINPKKNDTIYDLEIKPFKGDAFIFDQLGDIRFKIGPKSFFQTNTKQAKRLFDVVVDFANFKGDENVYDLYTGIGSIACYVASYCKEVTGIEEIADAIKDAKENATLNGIENATFYAGDVKDLLNPDFVKKHGKADLIITDPPRAGMHKDVVKTLLELEVPRMIYISCNPSTQARDILLLKEKYEVEEIQPVDMFPHTHHIENVVSLKLK